MKPIVQEYFNAELCRAKIAIAQQDFEIAWTALQRRFRNEMLTMFGG